MPYIRQSERKILATGGLPSTAGHLNYSITSVIIHYMTDSGGVSYKNINDVIGALEAAKMEFYRRVVEPYEDKKIKENGDVYTCLT